MTAIELQPADRVAGTMRVPGDKSISHRAVLLNAIAGGGATVSGLGPGRDVAATLDAVRSLGARVDRDGEGRVRIEGPCDWRAERPVDCGNSGTTARLLLGILAGRAAGAITLSGDTSLSRRPMARVIEPLRRMGAAIDDRDRLPITVTGARLRGCEHRLPVASAQVKTALLIAGLVAEGATTIHEPGDSRDHTERMLATMGAPIETDGRTVRIAAGPLAPIDVAVPGDLSSAAPFLALAAARVGHEIMVEAVGVNPTRTGFLDLLRTLGAEVTIAPAIELPEPVGTVHVVGKALKGIDIEAAIVPRAIDELPLLAVVATQAAGVTRVYGAAELRVKESDRIAAITTGLSKMGAEIEALPDGFRVRGPTPLRGARVDAAHDHRIGMALAVGALLADGPSVIDGVEWIDVSYPGFFDDLAACSGAAVGA